MYVAVPETVRLPKIGMLPRPLKLPPETVALAPLNSMVGGDLTVTAAKALLVPKAIAAKQAMIANTNVRRCFKVVLPSREVLLFL